MRIAQISPGAGGMYCGSCLGDNALAAALIRQGHEAALIPVYTPLRTDEESVSIDRVFYGAINVYLEQKTALFRHTPRLVDRLLNGRRLLGWAAARGSTVDARVLGDLTLSMLQGEHGRQRKELQRLVEWLAGEFRPEIVHLSNSMLLGMARSLRRALDVPVVCSVQGEDIFLDELVEPRAGEVRALLRERARDVDGFLATSRYCAESMGRRLGVPPERMHHVGLGLRLEGYAAEEAPAARPFSVGYLARICPEKGLHLLFEAFRQLVETAGPERPRLRIAGYLGQRDRAYFDGLLERLREWGLEPLVDVVGEVDHRQKLEFLRSLDVLSVPTTYLGPKGRFVLEALASGVPVVQPAHGSFPELLEATGGGLLFEPGSAPALAARLRELLAAPERRRALGLRGREAVQREFTDERLAERTLEVYRRYVAG